MQLESALAPSEAALLAARSAHLRHVSDRGPGITRARNVPGSAIAIQRALPFESEANSNA
jgi:hypothetical protein